MINLKDKLTAVSNFADTYPKLLTFGALILALTAGLGLKMNGYGPLAYKPLLVLATIAIGLGFYGAKRPTNHTVGVTLAYASMVVDGKMGIGILILAVLVYMSVLGKMKDRQ